MKHTQQLALRARTPVGKLKAYVGLVFSAVLLVRLLMAIQSMIRLDVRDLSAPQKNDPITSSLLWLTGHYYIDEKDYVALSQGVSLLLTVILSFSQVRTFLRTVSSVNRRLSLIYKKCYCPPVTMTRGAREGGGSAKATSPDVLSHVVASFTGCYCLSVVVMVKLTLPVEYRQEFVEALGGMDFTIQTSVVNATYAASAFLSGAILGALFGIQRQNIQRYVEDVGTKLPDSSV
mmetsp:Transcript_52217/g.77982  ORF Transcript_52217/g.77982 Transcript_52217/m.77982 type:complete len:233 (-) Transcript_52217:338-1036(-)